MREKTLKKIEKFKELIASGVVQEQAFKQAGIGSQTWYTYKKTMPKKMIKKTKPRLKPALEFPLVQSTGKAVVILADLNDVSSIVRGLWQ